MKKVLAWAVALALVLSSFTMAFAADTKTSADFKDASSIQYTEAVDVMVATGVINGYPDGTFGPQKTVKRSEMAKMIACIMNGGEDVGDQYKSACPFADSKDHWAAGYIAFCASEHIIDGRSADVFDPEAEVTGTEVAKMALTSLGYDSGIQGYTGENWAANVLKDAKKNKLFDGLDSSFVPGDPCSREAAAQILFNMLKAPMVEYDTNTSVTVGDATVSVNSKVNKLTPEDSGVKDDNGDGYTNLYEDVFGGDLSQNEEDADGFGSPAHSWTYEGDDIGTYVASTDYEFVAEDVGFEDALKAYDEDLYDDFDNNELIIKSVTVNGATIFDIEENQGIGIPVSGPSEMIFMLPGMGDTVKMFEADAPADYEGDAVFYDVVIEHYEAAQIDAVDTDISDKEAKKDITAKLDLMYDGEVEIDAIPDTELTGYDAETYVEGAVIAIAFNYAKEEIIDSYVMEELASGAVSRTYTDQKHMLGLSAVNMDGEKIEMATFYNPVDGNLPEAGDNEYTLYDYNGYALASVQTAEAEAEVFYGVLVNYAANTGSDDFGEGGANKAKIVTSEGEETVFTVSEDCEYEAAAGAQQVLIEYTLNEDGEVDSIAEGVAAPDALAAGTTMKTEGVLAGKAVSEDVVAFWIDPEDEDAEWVVYDFDALSDEDITIAAEAVCYNADGDEIQALLLTRDLVDESEDTSLGFITNVSTYSTKDGTFAEITALVDGKETTFTTAKGVYGTEAIYEYADPEDLIEFTANSDGELVSALLAEIETVDGVVEEFGDDVVAAAMFEQKVVGKKNNSLDIGTEGNLNYQAVGSAAIYYVNADGDLEVSSLSKIKVSNEPYVDLYQTDAEGGVWNIVVFYDANSWDDY